MGPDLPLPLPVEFSSVDGYVESLLNFTTSSWLLQTLCGGVHVLDFYTRSPDLYAAILPESWRAWFKDRDIMDVLDLLMREDLTQFTENAGSSWRDGPVPPDDLLQYIREVRRHLLARDFPPPASKLENQKPNIARHIAVGMKVKKVHEVDNFARYVDTLTADIAVTGRKPITHLVDFGSGQNYLGRALAAPPYSKHLVAVESKPHNIEGAKDMDVKAKLAPKPIIMRNKKEFRAKMGKTKKLKKIRIRGESESTVLEEPTGVNGDLTTDLPSEDPVSDSKPKDFAQCDEDGCAPIQNGQTLKVDKTVTTNLQIYTEGHGSVQYVEHIIKDGDLAPVINQVLDSTQIQEEGSIPASKVIEEPSNLSAVPKTADVNAMVISLHSCGNLVHHGLRSLLLNPSVSAVAMVGCCYNLLTERLGPPTYKLPTLRPNHPRLTSTSNSFDPHGFPMSKRLEDYPLPHTPLSASESPDDPPRGVRLNITARMMAVQAPFNWGSEESELFFSRHFFRALLQRIFLDRGVVSAPVAADDGIGGGVSASGHTSRVNWTPPNGRGPGLSSDGKYTPLTIGTLRKFAYSDFLSYVRAAVGKLTSPNTFCEVDPGFIKEKMDGLTDEEVWAYEEKYKEKKHELSVMWSLMAFSAGVVEAVVVVDRWLWLQEQEEVERAWVEPVFEYKLSPRNLVVVGIKK
ncbi:hypothetical protein P280DRAFT_464955 [Massarina eburnea CBS 473.64]|uniref:Methyltransferase domain-containing protein n=1 Tax=Massarina eburnea CBS 473.64 TaxID=1395130 RepID=A0A6A6SIF6_9PLEO|nr:hypothetical protein P280DRAFT_464955 [Massarina eburnea CBS 473.64]